MADWTLPLLSDLKVDVLNMLKLRDLDAITLAEAPTSPPVGAVRWNRTTKTFQSWDGAVWQTMVIAMVGGGTGAQTPAEILAGLGLGTMSTQNSNAVAISGGSITGLSNLGSSGNITAMGVYVAGSGGVTLTNSAGNIREAAIDNIINIAHINQNENITGSWTFNGTLTMNGHMYISHAFPQLLFYQSDGAANQKLTGLITDSNIFELRFYDDAGNNYSQPINVTRSGNALLKGTLSGPWDVLGKLTINSAAGVAINSDGSAVYVANGLTDGWKGIVFQHGGGSNGMVMSISNILYVDQSTVQFRSTAGTALHALLDSTGLTIHGDNSRISLKYIHPQGSSTPSIYTWTDRTVFASAKFEWQALWGGAGGNEMVLENNTLTLVQPGAMLAIGGASGMRMYRTGNNAVFCTHAVGGYTFWYNAPGTLELAWLNDAGHFYPKGGVSLPAGTADLCALRFAVSGNSGIYYNGADTGRVEFGAQFAGSGVNASAIRCHLNAGGKIDFLVGPTFVMDIVPGYTFMTNHICMRPANSHWVGMDSYPAYAMRSYLGYGTTSDIREKQVHGKLENVLELVDTLEPLITSLNDDPMHQKFPTFSAQDVRDKIDNVLGTTIAYDPLPDPNGSALGPMGMYYERMVPILWQMVRELRVRVKALEN